MSKRRLTQQQKKRIQAIQKRRGERKKEKLQQNDEALGPPQSGLIISHHGTNIIVEDQEGNLVRCVVRQNLGSLVCGDRVTWQSISDDEGVIIALEPRKTLLSRPDFSGKPKPVVANIEQIIIVSAIEPLLSEHLIDRYLVVEEMTGIQAIILVNKTDLCTEKEFEKLREQMSVYENIGYPIIYTSVKHEHGLDQLKEQLLGKSNILVGQSGVGKSSLVKALLPELDIRIGELSQATHGKHTTTTSVLYHLPFGGELIDSPGVRDFGIWHIEQEQIRSGFIEFKEFEGQCKFNNCRHLSEPGCAIVEAVEQGKISERRLESYRQMLDEVEQQGK